MRRRRTLAGVMVTWSFLIVLALVTHHWAAMAILICAPTALGIIALVIATNISVNRDRRRAAEMRARGEAPGPVQLYKPAIEPPHRRRGRRPAPPPEPLTGPAAARVDQEVMRARAEAGDTAPDFDDFVAMMRNAGAADLEDVDPHKDGDRP